MADAAILENAENAITPSPMDRFGWNLGSRIPSRPRRRCHDAVAVVTVAIRALNI